MNARNTIRICGVENDSIVDGPGMRMAIFLQGCPHACEGCHNPQSWPMDGGTETTAEALLAKIRANPLLTGVTLTGGEPLLQAAALLPLAGALAGGTEGKRYDLAIYTGYTFEEIMEGAVPDRDAVLALLACASTLIDGRFVLAQKSLALPFRGSVNQRILDLPASLASGNAESQTDSRWMYSK
ncbi:MAG: anaerobic ribonucleoside-triphosphate reductase activating protein [Clostridiales Family XIII bacterium]|jgi:anaerobic ribonucleoside-triphosphate reductase activating protein|nr:anaerobic ribonucleoside-triphosphate reductase activating protein [Clostridiales Family XIII bacterium]